jgi:antitoxin HigA-1
LECHDAPVVPASQSPARKGFPSGGRLRHNACARPPSPIFRLILSVRVPTSQPPERPGQILREEFIKTGRLTQAALAQRMNVPVSKVRGILSGEEGITAETALLLEAALGVEAEFWIRAQFVWDCYRLREVERRTAVMETEGKSAKRSKAEDRRA